MWYNDCKAGIIPAHSEWLVDNEAAQKEMCETALAASARLSREYLHADGLE